MVEPARSSAVFRFGAFEADLRAHQLRRNGVRVQLAGQPFQVLVFLLERAGEVVTRDQLREQLWSLHTFVDFEHGLNTAIKKLRQALGDEAENPRFIETIPRVGYRFIAPVDAPVDKARASVPPPQPFAPPILERRWSLVLGASTLLLLGYIAGALWRCS